jgi:hypothetical protein
MSADATRTIAMMEAYDDAQAETKAAAAAARPRRLLVLGKGQLICRRKALPALRAADIAVFRRS